MPCPQDWSQKVSTGQCTTASWSAMRASVKTCTPTPCSRASLSTCRRRSELWPLQPWRSRYSLNAYSPNPSLGGVVWFSQVSYVFIWLVWTMDFKCTISRSHIISWFTNDLKQSRNIKWFILRAFSSSVFTSRWSLPQRGTIQPGSVAPSWPHIFPADVDQQTGVWRVRPLLSFKATATEELNWIFHPTRRFSAVMCKQSKTWDERDMQFYNIFLAFILLKIKILLEKWASLYPPNARGTSREC